MRRLVPLSLVALLFLSGCLGALGGDATSTPERVDPAEADLPPGVTVDGVENASALAAAHNETLLREGFVLNGTFVVDRPNSGVANETTTVVAGPNAETFRSDSLRTSWGYDNRTHLTQRIRTQQWVDGDETFGRSNFTTDDSVTAGRFDTGEDPRTGITRATTYRNVLDAGEFAVESTVARDGHTFTTLVTNERNGTEDDPAVDGRLVVDERGVVHEAVVERDGGSDGLRNVLDHRLVELGTSPEEPDWVAPVREGLGLNTSVDGELVADGSAVAVTNTGDDTLPTGTVLELSASVPNAPTEHTLDAPLEPDETVYLYRTDGAVELTRDESVARAGDPFTGEVAVDVTLGDVPLGSVSVGAETDESNERTGTTTAPTSD